MKLPDIALFQGLSDALRAPLERAATTRTLTAGETLVSEDAPSQDLYYVLSGTFEVLKRVRGTSIEHRIDEIGPGEAVGELALFDGSARSATVRATSRAEVLALPYEAVKQAPPLLTRLGRELAIRLRRTSDDELRSAQQRVTMGALIVKIITLLCAYALLLAALPGLSLAGTSTTYLSLPVIAAFGYVAWTFIRGTGQPLSDFGLGTRNLFGSLLESAVLTVPFCALLVGLKWVVIHVYSPWRGAPLFDRPDWRVHLLEPSIVKLLLLYLASAIVQELIVRSALQASLEGFLGREKLRETLLVCALMFAVNHLHMSFFFAALVFLPGIFWGWLFSRRRHLIGPVLSHFVVGAFVFFVLGVSPP